MKRLIGATLATVFALAALGGPTVSAGSDAANGGGWIENPELRFHFNFHAKALPDGSAKGVYKWSYPAKDFAARIELTCLKVDGDRATLGGYIVRSTDSSYLGKPAFVTVVDGGKGAAARPDVVSYVHVNWPDDPCDKHVVAFIPVVQGNINVKDR